MNDEQYENVARQLKTFEDCKIENAKQINAISGRSGRIVHSKYLEM